MNQPETADTRDFFRQVGLQDAAALDTLAHLYGDQAELRVLTRLRALVLHSCVRDATALYQLLAADPHVMTPDHPDGANLINALVELRRFVMVSIVSQAQTCLSGEVASTLVPRLILCLGSKAPEWFFEALTQIARGVSRTCFGNHAQQRFHDELVQYIRFWGYDRPLVVAGVLRDGYFDLIKREPQGNWTLPNLPDEDDTLV